MDYKKEEQKTKNIFKVSIVLIIIGLVIVLASCSTMSPEDRALLIEDRAYERRMVEAGIKACVASGGISYCEQRGVGSVKDCHCGSKDDLRRVLGNF